jgi:hypothetical protein
MGMSAASEAPLQIGGLQAHQRPRFWIEFVFGAVSVGLCFFFPQLYG